MRIYLEFLLIFLQFCNQISSIKMWAITGARIYKKQMTVNDVFYVFWNYYYMELIHIYSASKVPILSNDIVILGEKQARWNL